MFKGDLSKVFVFTDMDLDGAGSLLALHWFLKAKPGELKFATTTVSNLRKELLKFLDADSFKNYDVVYFLDLDISTCVDLVDHSNVFIIDHHRTHVDIKGIYKNTQHIITETTSCMKLLYAVRDKISPKFQLAPEQQYLTGLVNDYDCYKFDLKETYDLNCLYTNTQRSLDKTRTHKFVERWYNGFNGFNTQESNIVKEYINGRDKAIAALEVFEGNLSISHTPVKVAAAMGSKYVNDICEYLMRDKGYDITFFVNVPNKHVSLRKKKGCPVDVSKLATKLCEGGGHDYAAGGKLTDTFMDFVKQLTPVVK